VLVAYLEKELESYRALKNALKTLDGTSNVSHSYFQVTAKALMQMPIFMKIIDGNRRSVIEGRLQAVINKVYRV